MRNGTLMFLLLQNMHLVRLTERGVETFLMRAAKLLISREISEDDWLYLSRLILFKLNKAKGIVMT